MNDSDPDKISVAKGTTWQNVHDTLFPINVAWSDKITFNFNATINCHNNAYWRPKNSCYSETRKPPICTSIEKFNLDVRSVITPHKSCWEMYFLHILPSTICNTILVWIIFIDSVDHCRENFYNSCAALQCNGQIIVKSSLFSLLAAVIFLDFSEYFPEPFLAI